MKCVIFDLDGTLLYTLEDLFNATNYALRYFNHKERTMDEVRSFVGNGIAKLMERAVGKPCSQNELSEYLDVFRQYYSKNSCKNTKPYEGIVEILEQLKAQGVKIAVNSNKYDAAVKFLCREYFADLISLALGESENCPKKPNPAGANKILKYFNCDKNNAVYVGDSITDIQTAKNANIPCISVTWGYCKKEILKTSNDLTVDNTFELIEAINNILKI